MISDNSTQLKAAKEELRKVAQSLDWDEPTAAGTKMGMEWAFFQPMLLIVGRICADLGPDCSLFVKSTKFSGMTELIMTINM